MDGTPIKNCKIHESFMMCAECVSGHYIQAGVNENEAVICTRLDPIEGCYIYRNSNK